MAKTKAPELVSCAFCKGTGKDPFGLLSPPSACQVCLGRGVVEANGPRVKCAYCHGKGVWFDTRLTCSSCGGKGFQIVKEPHSTCPLCHGSGVQPGSERHMSCPTCHGAGEVHDRDL